MIEPTVGRVVWFRAHDSDQMLGCTGLPRQPMAALVTYVHGPRCVNLVVFDPNGHPHSRTSITLLQAEDEVPTVTGGNYCEWMPYQIGQAKKHEADKAS